jgi:hypothetical protein
MASDDRLHSTVTPSRILVQIEACPRFNMLPDIRPLMSNLTRAAPNDTTLHEAAPRRESANNERTIGCAIAGALRAPGIQAYVASFGA